MKAVFSYLLAVIVASTFDLGASFGTTFQGARTRTLCLSMNAENAENTMVKSSGRKEFLQTFVSGAVAASVVAGTPKFAFATQSGDPVVEECISKCVYDCTKPGKDGKQKTAAECTVPCEEKCAANKAKRAAGKTATSQ